MNVIIIEDEIPAQSKLEHMLKVIDPEIRVIARLGSVKESRDYLLHHPAPDVAFVDIQLSDDHSFEIFRNYPAEFPVIFTTAYDQYILESFEHNAIDYLLKPITEETLRRSLAKLNKLENHFAQAFRKLLGEAPAVRDRIIVKKGTEFIALHFHDIAFFFTQHKVVFATDRSAGRYILDKNLTELEAELDKRFFFRLNRKFLVHIGAIEKYKPEKGKIRVTLKPALKEEIFVSKETAPAFRKWIGAV